MIHSKRYPYFERDEMWLPSRTLSTHKSVEIEELIETVDLCGTVSLGQTILNPHDNESDTYFLTEVFFRQFYSFPTIKTVPPHACARTMLSVSPPIHRRPVPSVTFTPRLSIQRRTSLRSVRLLPAASTALAAPAARVPLSFPTFLACDAGPRQ